MIVCVAHPLRPSFRLLLKTSWLQICSDMDLWPVLLRARTILVVAHVLWSICWQVFVQGGVGLLAWMSCKYVGARLYIPTRSSLPVLCHQTSLVKLMRDTWTASLLSLLLACRETNVETVSSGAVHRLERVRYMPYADERSYLLLRVVNAEFERLNLIRLKAIARAHRIESAGGEGVGWYQNAISEHLFLGHCLSWVDSPIPEIPIGCLDFLAEFYFTNNVHV